MEVMEVMAVVVASQVQSVGGRERFMQDNTLNSVTASGGTRNHPPKPRVCIIIPSHSQLYFASY